LQYLAIKQDLAEPDPLRLQYRSLIKKTIYNVVVQPESDSLTIIRDAVADIENEQEHESVQALVVEELRRLHEGVLARYGLRPSELECWRSLNKV